MNTTTSPAPSGQCARFEGSGQYVATDGFKLVVSASMTLQRPPLIKGELGTGKTMLAEEAAAALGMPLLQQHVKSTAKAQQGPYEYNAVSYLRSSRLGDDKVYDIHNYTVRGMLWQAFKADELVVLLIDEIDKTDVEFPSDLLRGLDRTEFYVYETCETIRAKHRPSVIITPNSEKESPDTFLRRYFLHYIKFPDAKTMQTVIDVYYPGIKPALVKIALDAFYKIRNLPGLKEKSSASGLIGWLKLLLAEDIPPEPLRSQDKNTAIPPLHGALLKSERDIHLFEYLVFINRVNH